MNQNQELGWRDSKNPQELDLSYCVFVTDTEFIRYLKDPKALEIVSLNISHTLLSDHSLLQLQSVPFKKLKYLDLSHCINFTEGSITFLLNSPATKNLEELDLSGNRLSDICLQYIFQTHNMYKLAYIRLNDMHKGQQGFTYKLFESLTQSTLQKTLIKLQISNSCVSYDSIMTNKPKQIYNQFLSRIIKDDSTFFNQLSLKSLKIQELIINRCDLLSNKFIKSLCQNVVFMTSIQYLDISHCKGITDKSLKHINEASQAALAQLKHLEIAGTRITGLGLDKLGKSKNLHINILNISKCDDVSAQDIRQFLDTRVGKQLYQMELSASSDMQCQLGGFFSSEFIIWHDFYMKSINIELYQDISGYYVKSGFGHYQKSVELDPFYKGFIQCHVNQLVRQLVLVRKLKIIFKVPFQDEELFLNYIASYLISNNHFQQLHLYENILFVNSLNIITKMLEEYCNSELKTIEKQEENVEMIRINYIDPILNEGINFQQIRNLILIRQDNFTNRDLFLINQHQNDVFSQLEYLSIKGCKRVTTEGLLFIGDQLSKQLNGLDIRKTGIRYQNNLIFILSKFVNLNQFNHNKIEVTIEKQTQLDELDTIYKAIETLHPIRIMKIINLQKKNQYILQITNKLAQLIKKNAIQLKKLDFQIYINENQNSEDVYSTFTQALLNCINLTHLNFTLRGQGRQIFMYHLSQAIMESNVKHLKIDGTNFLITDDGLESQIDSTFCSSCIQELSYINLHCQTLDVLLQGGKNLTMLAIKIDNIQFIPENLKYAIQNSYHSLKVLELNFVDIKIDTLSDLIQLIKNCETLQIFALEIESSQLTESFLTKLQDCLIKNKKLTKVVINFIACDVTRISSNLIDRLFKSDLQVLRINDLTLYY